jgi:hypothetical protein
VKARKKCEQQMVDQHDQRRDPPDRFKLDEPLVV